jgi:hypothetical protein
MMTHHPEDHVAATVADTRILPLPGLEFTNRGLTGYRKPLRMDVKRGFSIAAVISP